MFSKSIYRLRRYGVRGAPYLMNPVFMQEKVLDQHFLIFSIPRDIWE